MYDGPTQELQNIKRLKLDKKVAVLGKVYGFTLTVGNVCGMMRSSDIGSVLIGAVGTYASLWIMGLCFNEYDRCSRDLRRLTDKKKPVEKVYKK